MHPFYPSLSDIYRYTPFLYLRRLKQKATGMRTLILFLVFVALSASAQQTDRQNPYGLPLTNTKEAYQQEVAENPDMEMIDLDAFIPRLALDIRYATKNNFTGEVIYPEVAAFARRPVAIALKDVQIELAQKGLGLKIFDAYRPYAATLRFYEVYPDTLFVAAPWHGSRHNRGAAIDLTIIDLKTGAELEMPTEYDNFTRRASPSCEDATEKAIQNRSLLINIMRKHGFEVYFSEWWHFDYNGWEQFPLMDLPFHVLKNQVKEF